MTFKEFVVESAAAARYPGATVLLGGSYKPPHKGHWEMMKHYSRLVGPTGRVVVFISKPGKAKRMTDTGEEVTAETAKALLELYRSAGGTRNVEFRISEVSPIKDVFDSIASLPSGSTAILGVSAKGDDLKRFSPKSIANATAGKGVTVVDPAQTAFDPVENDGGDISASDIRGSYGDLDSVRENFPSEVQDPKNWAKVKSILGGAR